jgi:hypothetical protein
MSYSYGWEKLHVAVINLVGRDPLKKRVIDAVLAVHTLRSGGPHLPADTQDEFDELMERMTAVEPVGDEGSVEATANTLSIEELEEVAESIVSMYDDVTRTQDPF